VSVATCPTCGAAWNVAGLVGIPQIQCQRCGGIVPLGGGPPPGVGPAGMISGEGILAMPASPGTPLGENAIPCAHCGTVLEATGLGVGMLLRCGRCGGVFPRPHASQVAAALAQMPPQHAAPPQLAIAPSPPPASALKPSDSSG
jgi:hypothetical protein